MKKTLCLVAAAMIVALFLTLSAPISAQPLVGNADNGLSERLFGANGKIGNDEIGFLWIPTLDPSTTVYGLVAACQRVNINGNAVGNHKVVVKNPTLIGADSGDEARLPKKTAKVKKGLPGKTAMWDITSLVRNSEPESAVIGLANFKVTKTAKAGDVIRCLFAVVETDAALAGAPATEAERLEVIARVGQDLIERQLISKTRQP